MWRDMMDNRDAIANRALDAFLSSLRQWYRRSDEKPVGLDVLQAAFDALPDDMRETGHDTWSVFHQVIAIEPWSRHLVYEQIVDVLTVFGYDEEYLIESVPKPDIPDLDDLPPLQQAHLELLESFARLTRLKLTGRDTRERFNTKRTWQIIACTLLLVVAILGTLAVDKPRAPDPDVDMLVEARPKQFWRVRVDRQHSPEGLDASFLEMLSGVAVPETGFFLVTEQQ